MKKLLLFALGVVSGYFWLAPVFVPPGSESLHESGITLARFLRVISILFIFPLVFKRIPQMFLSQRIVRLTLLVFTFVPMLSLLFFPDRDFLVATFGPFFIAGLSLLCLCALRSGEFSIWVLGTGFAAFVFLSLGLSVYGLETASYYGSERASFGFIHPTQSSAVVLMAGIFIALCIDKIWRAHRRMRRFLLGICVVSITFLVILAYSRNMILLFVLISFGSGFYILVRHVNLRLLMASFFLILPVIFFGIAVYGDSNNFFWILLDEFSSKRFSAYQDLKTSMSRETIVSILFGPSVYSQGIGETRGFASSESAYFSIYVNFGIVTLINFFMLLFIVAKRLSQRVRPLAYGSLCALSIFYTIDAQGVTSSNLAIFLVLTYVLRSALSSKGNSRQLR
jgi:hypothetical protein